MCVSALHVFTKKQGKMNCTEQQHVQHVAESHTTIWWWGARQATLTSTYIQTKAAQLSEGWALRCAVCGGHAEWEVRILRSGSLTGCGLRGEEGRSAGRLRACDGCSRSKGREVRRGHVRKNHENSSGEFFGFFVVYGDIFFVTLCGFFPCRSLK